MNTLLIRLMWITALVHLGISLKEVSDCRSQECSSRLKEAVSAVLTVDWKPISVFPEEAKRFK